MNIRDTAHIPDPKRAPAIPADVQAHHSFQVSGFQVGIQSIAHVPDHTGRNRRLFEGWGSVDGIDYQDMEVDPEAFRESAADYLAKNPVILWNHVHDLPIGMIHEIVFDGEGLYIKAEVADYSRVFEWWGKDKQAVNAKQQSLLKHKRLVSIAAKCDEIWASMLLGTVRGLSFRGRARQGYSIWSPKLNKAIPRITEIVLLEVSLTAIQQHPNAKVTAMNTLAKSIGASNTGNIDIFDLSKSLDSSVSPTDKRLIFSRAVKKPQTKGAKSTMEIQELVALLGKKIEELEDGAELDADLVKAVQSLGAGFVSQEEYDRLNQAPPAKDEAVDKLQAQLSALQGQIGELTKSLQPAETTPPPSPNAEEIAALQARLAELEGKPAPLRSQTSLKTPEGAQPHPGGIEPQDGGASIQKALDIVSRSIHGVADYGKGEVHGLRGEDVMKLWMLKNRQNPGNPSAGGVKVFDGITISQAGQKGLQRIINNPAFSA